jgi:hypothetical protein
MTVARLQEEIKHTNNLPRLVDVELFYCSQRLQDGIPLPLSELEEIELTAVRTKSPSKAVAKVCELWDSAHVPETVAPDLKIKLSCETSVKNRVVRPDSRPRAPTSTHENSA